MTSLALVLTLMFAPAGEAQVKATPEPEFAMEIRVPGQPPHYGMLPGAGTSSSLFYEGYLRRLGGSDPQRALPSALNLEYKIADGRVLVTASVFYGEFDRRTAPQSLENLPKKEIGSYSAGLNQPVRLSEMEQYGLEPLTLTLVPAQAPSAVRPLTISKAPSVQIEIAGQDRVFYRVALRNLSSKTVTAVHVDMPENNGSTSDSVEGTSLIAPGAVYELRVSIPYSWRTARDGSFVGNPPPPQLVLETVFFADGTYEGDRDIAAQIKARRTGAELQWKRIVTLVDRIVADTQSDDDAKIARIRSEAAQLTEEPDPELLESVRAEFPGLSDRVLESVKRALRIGMNSEKRSISLGLKSFEQTREANAGRYNVALAQWWSRRRNQYCTGFWSVMLS